MAPTRISTRKSPLLRETFAEATLPSGLRVLVNRKPGYGVKYAACVADYGSADVAWRPAGGGPARRSPAGVAHFLEHKLFQEQGRDAFDVFAQLGASANAATSFGWTYYHFSCTANFTRSLDYLLRFVSRLEVDEAGVAREKEIIVQEIQQGEDDPGWMSFSGLLATMYARHPIREDIAGTARSVRAITLADLRDVYAAFYRPDNMALIVAGDVDPRAVVARAAAAATATPRGAGTGAATGAGGRARQGRAAPEVLYPAEPRAARVARRAARMDVSRPQVSIGFKDHGVPAAGAALVRREIVTDLLHGMLFSRGMPIHRALYEAGLISDDFGAFYRTDRGCGYSFVSAETDRPAALIDRLLAELDRLRAGGLDAAVFERKKRRALGDFVRVFNSPSGSVHAMMNAWLKKYDLLDHLRLLNETTLDQLHQRLATHLLPAEMATLTISPRRQTRPRRTRRAATSRRR